ncbi:MAG: protein kinase [Planctomycetia bacterium]|nr:protein kinase [Planctomycetia bacterium]
MNSWSNYVGQDVAGRYRLESMLGVGSFGAVYFARDDKTQQTVMLRLLPMELGGQSLFDVAALTDFHHPQAIGVSDVGEFEGTRYLVMPCAVGTRIQVREPWQFERVLKFVRQVSAPLIAFQKQFDLQHLHLHPGNVFVDETSRKPLFQVADLGLASQVGAGPLILEAIRERRTTPEFLSPEQLQGNVPSSQSDVYAFGAMLFHLISGSPPFPYSGESLSSYALHVSKTSPPRFKDVSDQLNVVSYLESIILRCLSKDAGGRPGSLQEFVDSFEMGYRDFQTSTMSGMSLASLNELCRDEFNAPKPDTTTAPIVLKPDVALKTMPPIPRSPSTLPPSDMLPVAKSPPTRNDEIPYRAYPHGTDTKVGLPGSPTPSNNLSLESNALLQSINPKFSPWSGMEVEPEKLAKQGTSGSSPRTDIAQPNATIAPGSISSHVFPHQPAPSQTERDRAIEQSTGTLAPNSLPRPTDTFAAQPHNESQPITPNTSPPAMSGPTFPKQESAVSNQWSSFGTRTPQAADHNRVNQGNGTGQGGRSNQVGADQTLAPSSSRPVPEAPIASGGAAESNLTMQMQQDWLRSQLPPAQVANSAPMRPRAKSKKTGTPTGVIVLVAGLAVASIGVFAYSKSLVSRVQKNVATLVSQDRYLEAKTALRDAHKLADIGLRRDEEIERLLSDGLHKLEQLQTEGKLPEAVLLTGQLDVAFALEPLSKSKEPQRSRQEIADGVKKKVLEFARQPQLNRALDELDGDVADAFRKVAKQLSAESSELNVVQIKRAIVDVGLELANERSRDQPAAAFEILDKWQRKFLTDDDISDEKKTELKERHCEARVRKALGEAKQFKDEARSVTGRYPAAVALLDNLLRDLDEGSCATLRVKVLVERSQTFLAWAEAKGESESDSSKRFEQSLNDLTAALNTFESTKSDGAAINGSVMKADVLHARTTTLLARGTWYTSQESADSSTQSLLLAVRDFKEALVDNPNQADAQTRLGAIREKAQSGAQDAFRSAQEEPKGAKSDDYFCKADRQLTLVIETSLAREDDSLAQYARLQRGLARSSFREPDYANAIADLTKSTAQASDLRLTEIGKKLLPDADSADREFQLQYWFAVGKSRLAWLVATCPRDDIRSSAKGTVKAVEQAQLAVATLQGMIDKLDQHEELREKLRQDACSAQKSLAVAWADAGQFEKAKVTIGTLQGSLDRKAKGWEADERNDLDILLQNYVEKGIPYRVADLPETTRNCLEK